MSESQGMHRLMIYRVTTIAKGEQVRMLIAAQSEEELREKLTKLGCVEVRTNPMFPIQSPYKE